MQLLQSPWQDIPLELLLIADPDKNSIESYIQDSICFSGQQHGQIVAVCVVNTQTKHQCEITNISVETQFQKSGVGSKLLKFALQALKSLRYKRVVLGTGTFGYQLTFYQRFGFRFDYIDKDYFLTHYPEPIFENGIQHKDRINLYLDLL